MRVKRSDGRWIQIDRRRGRNCSGEPINAYNSIWLMKEVSLMLRVHTAMKEVNDSDGKLTQNRD